MADSQKKLNLLADSSYASGPVKSEGQVKSESSGAGKDSMDGGATKEFLFDPYAAAYYSRFSDYMPGKHSLSTHLASLT